jgi:hypothetical protein
LKGVPVVIDNLKFIAMAENDAKKELINFINKRLFDPIIKAKPGKFDEKEQQEFDEVKRKTENEKKNFEAYGSADEIKKNYLSNVRSKAAAKVNDQLKKFDLPTMPEHKDEFMQLCEKLGI